MVINFEKIGPDPPPPQFEKEDGKEEVLKEGEYNEGNERVGIPNVPINTSWYNCRKMIYVPKTNKTYCVGMYIFIFSMFNRSKYVSFRLLAHSRIILA